MKCLPALLFLLISFSVNLFGFSITSGISTYTIIEGAYTWEEARLDAISRGGHLATITSDEEAALVGSIFNSYRDSYGYNLNPYIGLYSETSTGGFANWEWVTAETYDYKNWYHGLTTAGDSQYHAGKVVYLANDGGWYPYYGSHEMPYVLEQAVPEPSSYALLFGSLALGLVALRRR